MGKQLNNLWLELLDKIDYSKINDCIRIVSDEKIKEIDSYFCKVKALDREEYQMWRLIKKSIHAIYIRNYGDYTRKSLDSEELIAWACLDKFAKKGIPNVITANLLLSTL
jgi:hypothetical protein